MLNMTPVFIGFFPKEKDYESPFKDNGIIEICSVSECLRSGPEGWIDLWKHNDLGFYNSESVVSTIIQKTGKQYTIFAYKLFLFCYEDGELKIGSKMISRANELNITERLTDYALIGFDVVSCSLSDFFECSALSCNNGFKEYKVNEFCLLEDLDSAMRAQQEISEGNYEPGEQYLLGVYKKTDA